MNKAAAAAPIAPAIAAKIIPFDFFEVASCGAAVTLWVVVLALGVVA